MPDPVAGGAPPFSIRRWVQDEATPGSILFITSTHGDLAFTRALLTLWMDLAVNALMEMPRTRNLRMWYLFDEVHALHRLPAIEHGLQTARGFGGAFVLGMHSFDKLAQTYGEEGAINLASLARTKLILTTADRHTAEVCSDFIGSYEVRETDEAYSIGATRSRDAATITPRTEVKPLVLPDDLMNLPSLVGYVKFPEGFPAARVQLTWRDYPAIAEPYRRRRDIDPTAYSSPAPPDDGGPDTQGGRENALPIEPEKSDSREDAVAAEPKPLPPQGQLLLEPPTPISPTPATDAAPQPAPVRPEDDATRGTTPENGWRDSMAQTRAPAREGDARPDSAAQQAPVQQVSKAQPGTVRREQQIAIEERTGQGFADPGERSQHHHSPGHPGTPDLDPGIDDGRDSGL